MPLYAALYETACMTRQQLQQLAGHVCAAQGACRSRQLHVSLTGGRLVWLFAAPDRQTLDAWLTTLQMGNYEWLVRLDYEAGEDGELRDV